MPHTNLYFYCVDALEICYKSWHVWNEGENILLFIQQKLNVFVFVCAKRERGECIYKRERVMVPSKFWYKFHLILW